MRHRRAIALILAVAAVVTLPGCVATGGNTTAEVQKWRDTAAFYATRLDGFRALVASEPPGPKRDALLKEIDRIDHLRLYAEGMVILLAGPATVKPGA